MNGWDVLNNVVAAMPPVALALLMVAAVVAAAIFIAGFTKHGVDFIKHGFKQRFTEDLLAKLATKEDIGKIETEIDGLRSEIDGVKTELGMIKVNHFGHLKNYLGVLNGILLDKGIIDNESRARLDNELRGM